MQSHPTLSNIIISVVMTIFENISWNLLSHGSNCFLLLSSLQTVLVISQLLCSGLCLFSPRVLLIVSSRFWSAVASYFTKLWLWTRTLESLNKLTFFTFPDHSSVVLGSWSHSKQFRLPHDPEAVVSGQLCETKLQGCSIYCICSIRLWNKDNQLLQDTRLMIIYL